jgi:hypothetical protein
VIFAGCEIELQNVIYIAEDHSDMNRVLAFADVTSRP